MNRSTTNGSDSRAQRTSLAVERLEASRARWRAVLPHAEPAGGLAALAAQLSAVVQRHPGLCAAGAVLLGALLARAKPWRWALSSGLWAMLLPRLLPSLVSTLSSVRLGLWADLITAWFSAEGPEVASGPAASTDSATAAEPREHSPEEVRRRGLAGDYRAGGTGPAGG